MSRANTGQVAFRTRINEIRLCSKLVIKKIGKYLIPITWLSKNNILREIKTKDNKDKARMQLNMTTERR